jgi:hypothetical protein
MFCCVLDGVAEPFRQRKGVEVVQVLVDRGDQMLLQLAAELLAD